MKLKKHSFTQLQKIFKDGHDQDDQIFAEMRTNSQLYNSQHYGSKSAEFDRNFKGIGKDSKTVRITENHISKIVRSISNAIKSQVPDVSVRPRNMEDVGDQVKAEIHRTVLEDWKSNSRFKEEEQKLIKEWVIFGEMYAKIYFDPEKGRRLPDLVEEYIDVEEKEFKKKGFELKPEHIKRKTTTRFEGRVVVEKVYPFDVIRDPCAETFADAEWICIKKLVNPEFLKSQLDSADKKEMVTKCSSDTYQTFRINGEYSKTDDKVLVREYYFRKSYRYPNGYYFYTVGGINGGGILFEGELPDGVFPIEVLGYDEISTSPRFSSILRQLRPNQLAVNLMKSRMMNHVLRMGDDNVYIQKGGELSKPRKMSGIVVHEYLGNAPIVSQGRVGVQFIEPINQNIEQMYIKAGLPEIFEEKPQNIDAHTALYLSAKQKVRHSEYVCKYEIFLKRVFEKVLKLTKAYIHEETFINIAGKDEYINIAEFKSQDDLGFEIVMEGQTEDAESKLGRSLDITKILQYGKDFDPAQLGELIKNMPYLNNEAVYESFTQDYQNLRNDILSLERGEETTLDINPYENHDYMIQGIITRMKKSDFRFLSPRVQELFKTKIALHEQVKADQIAQTRALEADFVPTGGALLGIEGMYEPAGTTSRGEPKTKKVRLPQESLDWLRARLQSQGTQLGVLENQQAQVQADIANKVIQGEQQAQQQAQIAQVLQLNQGLIQP